MRAWSVLLVVACATGPSTPEGACGDGVVGPGEACDDGVNDGSYEGCMPGCAAPAPACGDGAVDTASGERCDDAANDGTWGGCRYDCGAPAGRCGDGVVDGPEVCDDGANDGGYGGCATGCQDRGPWCGDGVINGPERCDDGINDGSCASCAPDCGAVGVDVFLVEVVVRAVPDAWGWPADLEPDLYVEVWEGARLRFRSTTADDTGPPVTFALEGVFVAHAPVVEVRVWDEDGGAFGAPDPLGAVTVDTSSWAGDARSGTTRVSWTVDARSCR